MFECDLYILGMMAAHYSRNSGICPVRGGMDSVENRSVFDSKTNLWYSCSPHRKGARAGLRFSARETQSGPEVIKRWIPWESFRQVTAVIECEDEQ